jgi:hypothetical protein
MKECILIKTKDDKRFFTYRKYLQNLVNFGEIIEAEFFIAKTKPENILELKKLVLAICSADYKSPTEFKIIKPIENKIKTKASIDIRTHIKESFFKGKEVSLKNIKNEFKNCKLSDPSLCNYISKVRKDLMEKGFPIEKYGTAYRLKNI